MLSSRYKDTFNRGLTPIGAWLARAGVFPSTITLAGPLLVSVVCLWFLQTRRVIPFCLAILLVGALDGLDGVVARVSGRVTKFGGYLDAVCDRYFEAIVVLTVAAVTGYWVLSAIGLVGSLLVSYAKARAAMEVPVSNLEWPDVMEHLERGLLFIGGLALSAIVPWQPLGRDLFWWTLVLLVVLIHLTVFQRVLRARKFIIERAGR